MSNQFNVKVKTHQEFYVVACKDAGERNSVIAECVRDGYEHHIATDADHALEHIDYLDWNPA
ncbi:hypothetical protein [Pseudomonas koreensis]|uniref:hypothetical protein n=1 Tax=Pseudomonas koreensis TaxID=198620 RepID=UPI001B31A0A6|nr:hypothetical protein [Pseudomonas koreensis]MBP3996730.1 hypothetical protein [Pseudomonas koreensis]